MPYTTQSADFWGWYLRHNVRVVWRYMSDAGIDTFSVGPSGNQQSFLSLNNILPAMDGTLRTRWGLSAWPSTGPISTTATNLVRTFAYNVPQDASDPSNTHTENLWLATDNNAFYTYTDAGLGTFSGFGPSALPTPGNDTWGVVSREWFYYGNGVDAPQKVYPGYTTADTNSLVGIVNNGAFVSEGGVAGVSPMPLYVEASGLGYTVAPTVTVTDPTGAGSGCTITLNIDGLGRVVQINITNAGSGYAQANATVSAPPSGGLQANIVLYVQTNPSAPRTGEVVGADLAGSMQFISGRQYLVALQDSRTGHTSDVSQGNPQRFPTSGVEINQLTQAYTAAEIAAGVAVPTYAASTDVTAGFDSLVVTVVVPTAGLDPTVDTVILLATSDGGSLGTLYEVATLSLSAFTLSGSYPAYVYTYLDTLPDTYNDQNTSGNTLLEADVWAFTDSDGTVYGILLNTPPTANGFLYPTIHQGRMFATDGKTVFFSKSLEEVTTSSGLITSKWEECWPGDYQLPVALNNETIIGLKSDGTNLHIGTNKSIFTCYGTGPSDFSIPSQAFAQVGILNNDVWSVVYAEGMPAGFVWITPDFKVMHSDFITYKEIGTQVFYLLQTFDLTKALQAKASSLTYGPWNFAVFSFQDLSGNTQFLVWETRLEKWYQWQLLSGLAPGLAVQTAFVYQFPTANATFSSGAVRLFIWAVQSSKVLSLYFDPANTTGDYYYGNSPSLLPWNVKTSWQDMGDATAIKVIDEIELTTDVSPLSNMTINLYGATSQAQFDSGGTLLKSGSPITGPLAALNTAKFYCAGSATAAKYYSASFFGSALPNQVVLSSFSMENYPMARI